MIRSDGSLELAPRVVLGGAVAFVGLAALVDPITLVLYASYAVIGLILVVRRPRNLVSWLLVLIAMLFVGTSLPAGIDVDGLQRGSAPVADVIRTWLSSWAGIAVWVVFAILALVFPSGAPSALRRWSPATVLVLIGAVLTLLVVLGPRVSFSADGETSISVSNPTGVLPFGVTPFTLPVVLAGFAAAALDLFLRFRRAGDTERLQMRWLLAAIVAVAVGSAVSFALFLWLGDGLGLIGWVPALVAFPTVPIAIGVAVLRYRLYEIDRVVNRAIVYAVVTAVLAGVLAAASAVSQRVFIAITGDRSDVAVILTTLAVATLYAPIRKSVEGAVDRYFKYEQRLFGKYRDDLEALAGLIDPVAAARRLAKEAVANTGARGVAVLDASGSVLATAGEWPLKVAARVPIRAGGAVRLDVRLGPRRGGRPPSLASLEALAAVGETLGVTLAPNVPPTRRPRRSGAAPSSRAASK